MESSDPIVRLNEYIRRVQIQLGARLGSGVHGIVFAGQSQASGGWSALKVHQSTTGYERERDVYLKLRQLNVFMIHGCNLPILLNHDDALGVIEMSIVTRPFVLDFAGAYLEDAPIFTEELMAEWRAEKREQFGSRWPDVQIILSELANLGIEMVDVNPGNLSFGDLPETEV